MTQSRACLAAWGPECRGWLKLFNVVDSQTPRNAQLEPRSVDFCHELLLTLLYYAMLCSALHRRSNRIHYRPKTQFIMTSAVLDNLSMMGDTESFEHGQDTGWSKDRARSSTAATVSSIFAALTSLVKRGVHDIGGIPSMWHAW